MCMQVVECCGKNPLAGCYSTLVAFASYSGGFPADYTCACIRKTVWKIGLYRV